MKKLKVIDGQESSAGQGFYEGLANAGAYETEVERFVPGYQEIISNTIDAVLSTQRITESPNLTVIDLGCGPGNVTKELLRHGTDPRLSGVAKIDKIYCVDSDAGMISQAEMAIQPYGIKKVFKAASALEFEPDEQVDVVISNLMLHNLPLEEKKEVIRKIKEWLKPMGRFTWADFVKFDDSELWEIEMENRKKIALALGADPTFAEINFQKERTADHPITVTEMEELLREAGFSRVRNTWRKSTFGKVSGDKE